MIAGSGAARVQAARRGRDRRVTLVDVAARLMRQYRPLLTVVAVVIGALVVVAYLVWPRPQAQPAGSAGTAGAASLGDDPSLGPANAPVTIVEYGDFGCPSCKAWYKAGVLDQIRAKYGDKVRFVWRDFPIITVQSPKAGEAGQCANDQGKFWPYHDTLYNHAPALSVGNLKSYAAAIGLDTAKFTACLDSGQYAAKVSHSQSDAFAHGFRGTPGFLVNGQPLDGPPSFDYLSSLIDQALASK
jgi:protein-disulfide isomerase